ncbi:MAG: aminotransferase class V-fold PLP-dependent enzyme, partial [Acidimicrobiia bacterium]
MLDSQRHLFDVPADKAYLNSSYIGPRLKAVTEAGEVSIALTGAPWSVTSDHFIEPVERLRSNVGTLMGGTGEGVAIIPGISYGIGVAAANLSVGDGRTIVVIEDQFPSNVYPWRAKVAAEGGDIVTAPRSPHGWTQSILDRIDASTAIVTVPNCHWTDGSRVDLVAVGEAARSVGSALVVDASQSFGAMPFDVEAVQPDFMTTVGYKWQLGFYGIAYLWVAEAHRIGTPLEQGWIVRKGAEDFAGLVDYVDEYESGARRFDMGERSNFVGVAMANASVDQLLAWGPDAVADSLADVTTTIANEAGARGWEATPDDQRVSHFLGIRHPNGLPDGLVGSFHDAGVSVSIRGDSVRIAPHLHTTNDDLDRLFGAL